VKDRLLYKLKPQYTNHGFTDWENQFALYVGESVINRDDGVKITNLVFLLNGERRITDQSFWRCLEVING
jgi:hypothetical protein